MGAMKNKSWEKSHFSSSPPENSGMNYSEVPKGDIVLKIGNGSYEL